MVVYSLLLSQHANQFRKPCRVGTVLRGTVPPAQGPFQVTAGCRWGRMCLPLNLLRNLPCMFRVVTEVLLNPNNADVTELVHALPNFRKPVMTCILDCARNLLLSHYEHVECSSGLSHNVQQQVRTHRAGC